MGSGLSFAGGQAQGINQGMDNVLRAYSIASENSRANLAAHQRQAESMGDRELKARMFQQQQMMQMRELEQRDAEQNSRIEAQLALQDLHFTQREQSRLNQLQQGLAGVREMLTSGQITPEAAQEMEVQIRTGMSGLGVKKAIGELAIQDLSKKRAAEDLRYTEGLREETAQFRAKALPERFTTREIPGIGPAVFYEHRPGEFTMVQGKNEAAQMGETKAEWDKNYAAIRKEVLDYLTMHRDADRIDKNVKGSGPLEDPTNFTKQLNDLTAQWMSERHGSYANWPQEMDRILKARGQRGRPPGGPVPVDGIGIGAQAGVSGGEGAGAPPEALEGSPGVAPAAGPMGARPISPSDRAPKVDLGKPFSLQDPEFFQKLTPPQKVVMNAHNKQGLFLDDPRVLGKEKADGSVWVNTMRELMAAYGSLEAMPPEHQKTYLQAMSNFDNLYQSVIKRPAAAKSAPLYSPQQKTGY